MGSISQYTNMKATIANGACARGTRPSGSHHIKTPMLGPRIAPMRLRFRRSVRSLRRIDRAVIKGTAPIGSAVIAVPPCATETISHLPRLTPSGPPSSEPASYEAAQRNVHGPLHEASGGSLNRRSDEPGMTRDPCHLSVDAEHPPW